MVSGGVEAILWYLLVGGLFVALAATRTIVERLPLSTALLYLLVGVLLGPLGLGLLRLDAVSDSALLERVTEVAVIVSLFTAGLKLRTTLTDPIWRLPLRLASLSMAATVGLVALVGVVGLGLPLGAAVLLGAILAPTDPVLAAGVEVRGPTDRDRLRFGLTGEASLNDGTAFPFVMLGLGLLGAHELGAAAWRWLAVDVLWAVAGGLGIGWVLGTLVARLVLFLRLEHREAVGSDDFLALGLIAVAYGAALAAHAYGFLAVFAAGLALRHVEARESGGDPPPSVQAAATLSGPGDDGAGPVTDVATAPDTAPAYMAQAVLGFNQQLERIAEVAAVLLVGALLTPAYLSPQILWFAPLLFLGIRPLAVAVGLAGARVGYFRRGLIAWFGVRGVGSLYYLAFALQHGAPPDVARQIASVTLSVVAASVLVHGVSVTPLMDLYSRYSRRREHRPGGTPDTAEAADTADTR